MQFSLDKADNGQAVMDNLNTINFAVRTLQEIAGKSLCEVEIFDICSLCASAKRLICGFTGAVMERDPHTAVYSQIFEDM